MCDNPLKLRICLTMLFALAFLICPVFAVADDEEVNMLDLPEMLSDALGLPDTADYFAGKILATVIILSLFMVPTLFACNRFEKEALLPSIFVGLLAFGFCIAIGWLDYWFLLVICLIVGLMFAGRMRDWIGGGRG